MANLAKYISTTDAVRVSDPYVIFYQVVPKNISWDNTAQTNYFFVNSTQQDIAFADGYLYYDANSLPQYKLLAGFALAIQKDTLNRWIEVTAPTDATINNSGNVGNVFYSLPVASSNRLGGIKIGANLGITLDGTLSAIIPDSSTVAWNSITGKPTFATVATSGLYNDLIGRPAINFTTLSTTGTSGAATLIGGNLNIPNYAGAVGSLTTTGFSGPASLIAGVLNVPNYSFTYTLPTASTSVLGGVKIDGTTVTINGSGVISAVTGGSINLTTTGTSGNATLVGTTLNVPNYTYTLPTSSTGTLGGVKVDGSTIVISGGGVISAAGGGTITLTTLGTSGAATLVGSTLNVPNYTSGSAITTCMPLASTVGILANGSDMTSTINTVLSNSAYCGIIFDYSASATVVVNGAVNGQGKVLSFRQGNLISGTGSISNFVLDCGLRQQVFNIGSAGSVPSLTIDPIGTTLSVVSPWVFGATVAGVDCAKAFQATVDMCIRNYNKISKIIVPSGQYRLDSPLIEMKWGGAYAFHMISIEGENTFSSADGSGSTLDFSNRKNSFGIGIHLGKGSAIKNLKLIGGFNYSFPGAYTFYTTNWTTMSDGVSRDTGFSPNSAIVIDPFGCAVPSDGGWPGNDAYGIALSSYYRGSCSGAGTTGPIIEDIFITNWVVGIICSPSGQTANAELVSIWKAHFSNMKLCIASCQAEEKMNVIRHIESWGVTGCIFATGLYGAGSIGTWTVEDVNIAGYSNTFIYNVQQGYFPSYFTNVYAESLGTFGTLSSNNGSIVSNSTFNFPYYDGGGSFCYLNGHITGQGMTFIGCQLRMYGTLKPITIYATNGSIFFRDCSFETVPFYNQDYTNGYCGFSNCNVGGAGFTLAPVELSTLGSTSFSTTYAYGVAKLKIGTGSATVREWNMDSSVAATRMPINRTSAGYLITKTLVGNFYEATITCIGDELNRINVGDPIVADINGTGLGIKMMGIVASINSGAGTFIVRYMPPEITTATTYYLYVWLPLKNVAFTGNTTAGSNLITNVSIIDGNLTNFVTTNGVYGGLLITNSFKQTDSWSSHMIRPTNWNSGTSTLTCDRNATVNATKLLFTQNDSSADFKAPPTIVAGAGAGSGPTLSIIKGNDGNHQVSVLTGTGTTTGILATVNFSMPFVAGRVPTISFSPANANAAALTGTSQIWMDASLWNNYTINTGSAALSTATTYLWNVVVN